MEIYLIFLGFIFGLISSLLVYYITENSREIRDQKIAFHKLSLEIRDLLIELTGFKSSSIQYSKSCDKFKAGKIDSTGFPNYNFPQIKQLIPFSLYRKETKSIFDQLILIDNFCYSLNNLISDLNINEIKDHLLSSKVGREEALSRYLYEGKVLDQYLIEINNYIEICFTTLSALLIINEKNSTRSISNIKVKYTDDELKNRIKKEREIFFASFISYDEVN